MTTTGVRALSQTGRRDIAGRRLAALGIAPAVGGGRAAVAGAVRHHLAMQAQDLASGLWSIGVRTGASLAEVEAAIEDRLITRSWPMRGTLHFLATEDVRWMCQLLNTTTNAGIRARWAQLEITDRVLHEAREVVVAALSGGHRLSRPAVMELFRANGIEPDNQRGVHLIASFCRDGLLCQGPAEGKQPTFVLLDEWVPESWAPEREEAMAALAERYVLSHGPVTERDLARWAGQTLAFAREAVALVGDALRTEEVDGIGYLVHRDAPEPAHRPETHLLPGFDEYLLGYQDRSAMLTAEQERRVVPGGNGVFLSTVVAGRQVVGTWGRRVGPTKVDVTVTPFAGLSATRLRAVERAATAYGEFLGLPAVLTVKDADS